MKKCKTYKDFMIYLQHEAKDIKEIDLDFFKSYDNMFADMKADIERNQTIIEKAEEVIKTTNDMKQMFYARNNIKDAQADNLQIYNM